jgi:hypothetical protein
MINAPPAFWRIRLSTSTLRLLAKLWPWAMIAFAVWSLGGWIFGHNFNQTMKNMSFVKSCRLLAGANPPAPQLWSFTALIIA